MGGVGGAGIGQSLPYPPTPPKGGPRAQNTYPPTPTKKRVKIKHIQYSQTVQYMGFGAQQQAAGRVSKTGRAGN